ncbi:MAG TPA: tRNA pseudouridine(55) synthase TruB [Acidimicrobiales bacterium]|nr:tRNA pseudouridine(55) synthase TruB [Acidimicrobiales bacterium]
MIDGFVVIDKPAGWTSHDVVARCRKVFGQKRVGHAGTLDPDATGVLLVGLGRATRLLKFVGDLEKAYVGEVVFGATTTTLDASGEVTATFDMSGLTLDAVRAAATGFVGDIEQIPPLVSAVQIDGQRLHNLARQGVEVERKPRPVTVHSFDVREFVEPGVVLVDVVCSTGTYVRTLADDLGRALGGGAHLRNLRRRAVGSFSADDAVPLDALWPDHARPMADLVVHLPTIVVDDDGLDAVAHGRALFDDTFLGLVADRVGVLDAAGQLVAVYQPVDERLVPDVVLVGS